MTLSEAIATQPAWIGLWLNVLLLGAFVAPLLLLIWKGSRIAGLITLGSSLLAGIGINLMYAKMGYVKLLGLPHIILWTPVVIYLLSVLSRGTLARAPRIIMTFALFTISISLVFDYVDAFRYLLGNRTPMAGTP